MIIAAIGHSPKLIGEINLPKLVDLLKAWLPAFEPTQIITGLHPHIDLALGIAGMEMRLPVQATPTYYDPFAAWAPGVREWRGRVALYSQLGNMGGSYRVQLMAHESDDATYLGNTNRLEQADIIFKFAMDGIPGGTATALAAYPEKTVIDLWTPYFAAP